ncbi:hypothetical protein K3Z99_27360, partial [Pseudomonas aeruginosa]|nr:hypothetical protein [Pseudomonas aeruginosa]
MSTAPVTLLVARRVAAGRYRDFLAWQREGEALAADFPGYLGSGALAPPAGGDEFQMIFRFADDATLAAWVHSASRQAWLERGQRQLAEVGAGAEVEGQRDREERQPDRHALL